MIFLLFFLLYNIFLIICNPKITRFQNQWQKNYATAQEFIYEEKTQSIIVGSSLSARLIKNILPSDCYNLSFSGGSTFTGLELIKRTGYTPKHIFIETNFIFRGKDTKMLNNLFYPIWWEIKKHIPALREKFQPLNVLYSNNKCYTKPSRKRKESKNRKTKKNLDNLKSTKSFKLSFTNQKQSFQKKLNYKYQLKDLKRLITYFETKGTKVIFYEMPIEKSLSDSPKAKNIRNILKTTFKNKWLPFPKHENYFTTDSIHLHSYSAWVYTREFLKNIDIALPGTMHNH